MEKSNHQLGMTAARTETQKPLPRGTGARPSAGIKFAEMLLALPLDSRPHFAAIDVGNRSRPIVMADVSEICEAVYGSQAPCDETKGPDEHLCGGAIMGTDPNTSAINRYQQS